MRPPLFIIVLPALAAILAGCSSPDELAAPDIHLGEDVCATCGMIISDDRHAGALAILKDGRVTHELFDDIGEMLKRSAPAEEHTFYVRTVDNAGWVPADDAAFVRSDQLNTPMATGIAAFSTEEEARRFVEENSGDVLTLAEAAALPKTR